MHKSLKTMVVIAYVPVVHRGYMQFFKKYAKADALYVIGEDLLKKTDYLRKDLRALKPSEAAKFMNGLKLFKVTRVLDTKLLKELDKANTEIVLPDEDISRAVGQMFKNVKLTYFPVFLRWDRQNVEELDQSDPDETLSMAEFDQKVMKRANQAAAASSDIFRRVGAVVIDTKGEIIGSASNQGEPTPHSPWMEGDPRNVFNRGVAIEMSLFTHAEARLIAEAAKAGTSLAGASLYVTTFPCPACSKLVAHSGIKAVYYKDGYAVLDGKRIMTEYGISLARVLASDSMTESPDSLVPYVKKS